MIHLLYSLIYQTKNNDINYRKSKLIVGYTLYKHWVISKTCWNIISCMYQSMHCSKVYLFTSFFSFPTSKLHWSALKIILCFCLVLHFCRTY